VSGKVKQTRSTSSDLSRHQLRLQVEDWKQRLGLATWKITIKFADEVEFQSHGCLMFIERSEHYDRATLTVHNGIFDHTELPQCLERDALEQLDSRGRSTFIEAIIVHELLHLLLRDLAETAALVSNELPPSILNTWNTAWLRTEEATVERAAVALVAAFGQPERL
jgi:hypothetical protein